jgi:glyceraldehyde 3-phosphate dehydrogenase
MGTQDLAAVTALESLVFSHPWTWADFMAEHRHPQAFCRVLTETADSHPLAYLCCRKVMDGIEILKIAVHPQYQQRGFAKRLMADLYAEASTSPTPRLFLEVASINTAALSFYRDQGFKSTGIRKRYYPGGIDALNMMKNLEGGTMTIKVAINGLGRIGRVVFRCALQHPEIEIAAINDLGAPETMAHLLSYDSVHGRLNAQIEAKPDAIVVNGRSIPFFAKKDPAELPWKDLGIDIAAECTGVFVDREKAQTHLQAGAKRVIISAPGKNPDATFVMGVNEETFDPEKHFIVSNASCTTNCLAPVAKVLMENFGIRQGLMTTIHSYTGDQRILDFPHKDLRRARAAGLSMVPTTTGAAKAVGLVLPSLQGRLNGLSIRVPTPNVSMIDLVVNTERKGLTKADVNAALKAASEGALKGILGFEEKPLVSMDFNGCPLSSIVDAPTTETIGEDMVKVLAWYDNETGYSQRMVDLAAFMGKRI